MIETNEGLLELARQHGTEVLLVLDGRFDTPHRARVTGRNGPTFELELAGIKLRMDISSVVLCVP